VEDPNTRGGEPRLDASRRADARVVLAETDAPGTLHYLIEAEGFRVAGCAADESELRRVLEQDLQPEVIVLDTDISATALLVARELSPSSHVIVIWPEGVQVPSAAERIAPSLVYEQLGPAIRRATVERWLSDRSTVASSEEPRAKTVDPTASAEPRDPRLRRTASRVSVMSMVLIAAILLTMGASFALDGWRAPEQAAPPSRSSGPQPTAVRSSPGIAPTAAQSHAVVPSPEHLPCTPATKSDRDAPNAHAAGSVRFADDPTCRRTNGGPTKRPAQAGPDDHGQGNSSDAGSRGNGGAQDGHPDGAANDDHSGGHGRSDQHSASPSGSDHAPKN
jgi:hypothetical protein